MFKAGPSGQSKAVWGVTVLSWTLKQESVETECNVGGGLLGAIVKLLLQREDTEEDEGEEESGVGAEPKLLFC